MGEFVAELALVNRVNSNLSKWKQGDVAQADVVGHICLPAQPLTSLANELEGEEPQFVLDQNVTQLVLISQIATLEKSFLLHWDRTEGCRNDRESQMFSRATGRRFQRHAFPNDFTKSVSALATQIMECTGKESNEGKACEIIQEIRVAVQPNWNALEIVAYLWFCCESEIRLREFGEIKLADIVQGWVDFSDPVERIKKIEWEVISLERLTAREYLDSDPLDLEHLSF